MARTATKASPKVLGLGFVPDEARHGFLLHVPKGSGGGDLVCIQEMRGPDLFQDDQIQALVVSFTDPAMRVIIDRTRWLALAPAFWDEANRRLRANGLPMSKFVRNPARPVPIHPSLGKELCILCWAVEESPPDDIPNALRNWEALAPEKRWWLFTMAVATTGQALKKGVGWRKALRAALADNPFVKGEGMSPRLAVSCWPILSCCCRYEGSLCQQARAVVMAVRASSRSGMPSAGLPGKASG